jgi:hypothetical protein
MLVVSKSKLLLHGHQESEPECGCTMQKIWKRAMWHGGVVLMYDVVVVEGRSKEVEE